VYQNSLPMSNSISHAPGLHTAASSGASSTEFLLAAANLLQITYSAGYMGGMNYVA